ncbi:catecholate siderophore receptor Fiu [Massilia endophytica]|uniref:catecholate siderophore receptor Fiu n=1 Tax=Massilia endophytica TaxID=2899220 RepID=UPI001E44CE1D|nr:catecholate siderophore receptor Fiu [Massilia endophytica]UGQ45051.1 catecholate siderophore receptor Fiu [Massilia endophytica]
MSPIRSRKHTLATQPLLNQSLFALAAIGLPMAASAQVAEKTMSEVKVEASADLPYKAEKVSSPKLTQPLVDTPQTISIIKKEVLQEQGASSIVEALRNTPGITMQLGENGNTSAGDTFQMRGFSAQTSVFIDGIRDLGAVTRDAFNIEQVEVSKGPAGADIGRGATAGYINLVSKLPSRENSTGATVSYNSGETKRATADLNRTFGETGAFRLNVYAQDGGQMGRKVIDREGRGIAPSVALGLGTPTRVYLFSQHVRQDNKPDGGLPSVGIPGFYNASASLRSAPRVDRENYYGLNSDYEKIDADMGTVKIEHELGSGATLTNTTRYGKSSMDRILTGINTLTASGAQNTWTVSRSRQSVLQDNEILANTTNLVSAFKTGDVGHTLSAGIELLSESQFSPTRAGLGTVAAANLYAPNPADTLSAYAPALTGAYTDGKTRTAAVYAFDTIELSPQWQLNGGLRYEHYKTATSSVTASTATSHPTLPVGSLVGSRVQASDELASFKAGVLYKPATNGSVYLSYANSKTPPGSANFSLSATAGNINNPNMEPQQTTNIELGTKWDVLQNKLALTAALYRTENENEITLLDTATNTYSQLGKRRVEGVELGAVGQITDRWNIIAGLATMDATIKEGTTGNNAAGAATRWSPDLSATLWTSYKLSDQFTVGGGARYMSKQKRVIDPSVDVSLQNVPSVPSYAVADAMLSYKVNKNVSLQLNVYNVFDKFYLNTLNNSGARLTLGAERSAQLTASFLF